MKMKIYRTSGIFARERKKPYENAIQADDGSYVIEVNTLEELLEVANNTEKRLVIETYNDPQLPSIEIYDEYRE